MTESNNRTQQVQLLSCVSAHTSLEVRSSSLIQEINLLKVEDNDLLFTMMCDDLVWIFALNLIQFMSKQ